MLQISWRRGRITSRISHCDKRRSVSVDDQQEVASLAATNPLPFKKIFLVYMCLDQMLIGGRTNPEASASLPLKTAHCTIAGGANAGYKAVKKARPE